MTQNLIQITITDEQVAAANAALDQLEAALSEMISLDPTTRKRLNKMGPKSEVFCRQCLSVLAQNPQIVPPGLNLADAQADLVALDRIRPLLDRVQRLMGRGRDTEMALGSDAMRAALAGYRLLEVLGKHEGLEEFRKELGLRWAKSSAGKEDGNGEQEPEVAGA